MVLAKSGVAGSWVMASTSAVWSAKARSKAGRKCSGLIASNGGVSSGVCQGRSNGFSSATEGAVFDGVSDIAKSCFSPQIYGGIYITRCGIFAPFALVRRAHFGEIAARTKDQMMSTQAPSTASRQIVWPSVITVISAAILIGAEVFGAAFAGGWALAILFGLDDTAAHILQAVLFGIGVLIMAAFIRAAQRIEPFFKRA